MPPSKKSLTFQMSVLERLENVNFSKHLCLEHTLNELHLVLVYSWYFQQKNENLTLL